MDVLLSKEMVVQEEVSTGGCLVEYFSIGLCVDKTKESLSLTLGAISAMCSIISLCSGERCHLLSVAGSHLPRRRTGSSGAVRLQGATGVDRRQRAREDEQLSPFVLCGIRFSLCLDLVPTTEVRGNIL